MTQRSERMAGPRRKRRGWRWLRLGVGLLGSVLLVAGFVLWLVTRSWFIVDRVTPLLEQRIGGEVAIGGASYDGDGKVTLRDVRVALLDAAGTGGGDRADRPRRGEAPGRALLRGQVDIEQSSLDDVHVRVSESRRDAGEFNFMTLRPTAGDPNRHDVPPRSSCRRRSSRWACTTARSSRLAAPAP